MREDKMTHYYDHLNSGMVAQATLECGTDVPVAQVCVTRAETPCCKCTSLLPRYLLLTTSPLRSAGTSANYAIED